MNSNEVENIRDLIVKIYRYKFITLSLIIIIPICAFLWESNKKIVENYRLRIQPMSIMKFEKNFPEFSFNYNGKLNLTEKKHIDSLYSLNFSPLSFLHSFTDEINNTISKNSDQLTSFGDLKLNTLITFDNSSSLHSLQIDVLNLEENQNVKKFLENLLKVTNENLKEDFKITIENHLIRISENIDILLIESPTDLEILSKLKIQMTDLKKILDKSQDLEFVSMNIDNVMVTDNKINKSKLLILSIFVSFIISIGLILFIPSKN